MLPIISISSLLCIGIILLMLEILVIPGLPIVGFIGILFKAGSILACYYYYGATVGMYYAISVIFFTIFLIIFAFKSNFWNKFALNKNVADIQVKQSSTGIVVGEIGLTKSSLRPSGRAEIHGQIIEVTSVDGLTPPNTKVVIVLIEHDKIFVKTII